MSLTGDIWLPVKVNKPQAEGWLTGNYALCWHKVYARYKTGKTMTQESTPFITLMTMIK